MNVICKYLIPLIAMLPASLMAQGFLADHEVKYAGEPGAVRVCQAVIHDDPRDLMLLLKRYKNQKIFRHRFDITSQAIAGSFTCNRLALLPFANDVGASKVARFLNGGTVTMEELVSSTN